MGSVLDNPPQPAIQMRSSDKADGFDEVSNLESFVVHHLS
jgi:hypothetical protein